MTGKWQEYRLKETAKGKDNYEKVRKRYYLKYGSIHYNSQEDSLTNYKTIYESKYGKIKTNEEEPENDDHEGLL